MNMENQFAWNSRRVTTLLSSSLQKVLESLPHYLKDVESLPPNIKDRLLLLMSKRGLLTDSTLPKVLHKKVSVLDLTESEVSDVGLRHIGNMCPLLRHLDLNSAKASRTAITSQGVLYLASQCRHLQTVYLRRCLNVGDDAVVALCENCPGLLQLNLGGNPSITDRSLMALGQHCHRLTNLDISKSQVTDDGLIALASGACSNALKELHLNGCVKLTDESVEAVIQFCPNISILLFHGCPNMTDRSRVALEDMLHGQAHVKQLTWTVY